MRLLQFPYALYNSSQQTATGGSSVGNTGWYNMWFYVPPPGFHAGNYRVRRYEVQKTVTFPVTFQSTPNVWGRGVATNGYSAANPNWNMSWCEPVVGTITPSGCTLRTFVYEVRDYRYGTFLGWWPTTAGNAQFAYSVHGTVTVTEIGSDASTAVALSLSSSNPLRPGTTIALAVPQQTQARVELFDVAGRRVRVLHEGVLVRGRHEVRWDGLSDGGQALASGLYFARLETRVGVVTRKLLILE